MNENHSENIEKKPENHLGGKQKDKRVFRVQMTIMVVLGVLLIYSLVYSNGSSAQNQLQGQAIAELSPLAAKIIPTGIPAIYGKELGVSFDDVSVNNPESADATIKRLGALDNSIQLSGAKLERYVNIASNISCEYCCGAKSVIFTKEDDAALAAQIQAAVASGKITAAQAAQYQRPAGTAACGCAHSYAMRGLAKYLLAEHGDEYTDEQILEELGKWKVLFFPGVHEAKAQVLESKGIELNYINLASNKYRGIEKGQSGDGKMVGGC